MSHKLCAHWHADQNQAGPEDCMRGYTRHLFIMLVSAIAGPQATASDLPRYRFEVGQELVYAGSSDFNFDTGAFHNSNITRFWVTGQNTNGSWNLICVDQDKEVRTGDIPSTNETISLGHLDLFSDGRKAQKHTNDLEQSDSSPFIPLPGDAAQVKSGWQVAENEMARTIYHVRKTGNPWIITSTDQGIFRDIFQMGTAKTIYFDDEQGRVAKIESKSEQGTQIWRARFSHAYCD